MQSLSIDERDVIQIVEEEPSPTQQTVSARKQKKGNRKEDKVGREIARMIRKMVINKKLVAVLRVTGTAEVFFFFF